jgi:hypothetical protein
VQKLVLVVLRAAEFADHLAKRVVLVRAESREVVDDKVVDGEDVCEFDVQCRLCASEQIVELVNLKLSLGVTDVDEVGPDVL